MLMDKNGNRSGHYESAHLMETTIISDQTVHFLRIFVNTNLIGAGYVAELGRIVYWTKSGYALHLTPACGYLNCATIIYGGPEAHAPPLHPLCKRCALYPEQAVSGGPRPFVTCYTTESRWALMAMRIQEVALELRCQEANNVVNVLSHASTVLRLSAGSAPAGGPGAVSVTFREDKASTPLEVQAGDARDSCSHDGVHSSARLIDQVHSPARVIDHCPTAPGPVPGISLDPFPTRLLSDEPTLSELVDHFTQGLTSADVSCDYFDANSEPSSEGRAHGAITTSISDLPFEAEGWRHCVQLLAEFLGGFPSPLRK